MTWENLSEDVDAEFARLEGVPAPTREFWSGMRVHNSPRALMTEDQRAAKRKWDREYHARHRAERNASMLARYHARKVAA